MQEALELEQMEGGNQGGIGLTHKKELYSLINNTYTSENLLYVFQIGFYLEVE